MTPLSRHKSDTCGRAARLAGETSPCGRVILNPYAQRTIPGSSRGVSSRSSDGRRGGFRRANLHRFIGLQDLPPLALRALEEDQNGERRPRSRPGFRCHSARPFQGQSTGHVYEAGHRLRVRQQVEAALFHEGGRRLLPLAGAMGCGALQVAALLREERDRLVVRPVPGGQHEAARSATVAIR